jgi:hypothetical protein
LVLWLQARRRKAGPSGIAASDALTPEEQARLELLMANGAVPTVSAEPSVSTEKASEARG